MTSLRLVVTPNLSGPANMAIDMALAKRVGAGESRPAIRFYSWKPYCLSLGYHQKASDVDFAACAGLHIDVVRRPTGGMAVLHAEEFTYSVIIPAAYKDLGNSIKTTHIRIGNWLVNGLRRLGIEADLGMKKTGSDRRNSDLKIACFVRTAENEVTVANKKLIGSAQRRWPHSVLQHGSILVGNDHRNSVNLLKLIPSRRGRLNELLRSTTTCLNDHTQNCPGIEEFADLMAESWTEIFGGSVQRGSLSPEERKEARTLMGDFVLIGEKSWYSRFHLKENEYSSIGAD